MNLLVCEFITGGGMLGDAIPAGLGAEGEKMLQVLLRDLAGCANVDVTCTRDARLSPLPDSVNTQVLSGSDVLLEWLDRSVHAYDAVWVIAPESDEILYQLVRIVEQQSVQSLGCCSDVIRLCTNKRLTADRLSSAGIEVVSCIESLQDVSEAEEWVVKPVDGAGSDRTYYCASQQALIGMKDALLAEKFVIQPYIKGVVASMSLYCQDGNVYVLAVNQQQVEIHNGRFVLKAIHVNGLVHEYHRCQLLAEKIIQSIQELKGYIGVDFILTADGPVLLEINPRLTSSYCGLAKSTGINLARLMLDSGYANSLQMDHRLRRDRVMIHL